MEEIVYDIVIIGGGPAGLTAGMYAARAKLNVILIEKKLPGGQCLIYETVENYPGFPDGIEAPVLMERMKLQGERFGLKIIKDEVLSVSLDGDTKMLQLKSDKIRCKSVIVTSGAQPRKLAVPGEKELTSKGVSYCATCDGAFFEDCIISVVGGGDQAVEEALYLTKFGSKVYIIHRRDELRATKIIQEKAFNNEKIEFIWDTVVTSIEGDGIVNTLRLKNLKTGEESTHDTDAVFIFVGTRPDTEFLRGSVELDNSGFVIVNQKMETNVQGIYAAGDVISKECRQISTAVGEGALAAFNAGRFVDPY